MSYMRFILVSFILILFFSFTSCNRTVSEQSNNIYDYEQNKIDSIIAHNNMTIIYLWTEWCYGSRFHFIKDVVPYLQQKSDSIGFISIFYGNIKNLESIIIETECDYPTFIINSRGGWDKIRMSKLLKSFLKDYRQMDYVPVSLICDKKGNILNYNTEEKKYSHITDCILSVADSIKSVNISYDTISPITQE